ncbi:MAG: signal recognition particle protein [Candidatus Altiarchaeum hamiconexum]|uniref:Signal recognition particle 54 kDa protein n=1 Tax=Candidatus Altarchaeum hamiconexum TaxID=1803513 RepID=A0A8J7YSV3_9ARCH|nr:signal recognition particle protein [Candidatus Altarchaeum hamiconexum]PIN67336.1 MAG: signal recognition particle protein [Candidatus Altarchaeum sp. CG12_big_fil_rev_8_21_14_0_65_33_22]PIX48931.1 MAG: signal recognition particle protein [Candidatus Altarchaeum sp. CG_4_8_14_3_um_filter_33_2054]PIZ31717.1 MAG: signal recognition particle protein [Candidatus Altarchaeum sp. CG_4_10_14_0_8_um_filter_32_851]NCN68530.1 signal recognition particle protein [Candidatus Altarchaeum hamiconexum]
MFDKLSDGLRNAITSLRKAVVVDKKVIKEFIKEVQKALISSDVNVRLVLEISKRIEDKGLLEKPPGLLDRKEHIIKITYDELTSLLGKGDKINLKKGDKILLVGIQGGGKTTTAAKLAKYYNKKGFKVGLICADTFRAGAYTQLMQLAEEIKTPFYGDPNEKISLNIIKKGLEILKDKDVIIIDSEGRNKLDNDLMRDINLVYTEIKPEHVLLVLDGTIGQLAGEQAEAFKKSCNVTGVILTKLDGTAKGGGAISACKTTNAKVYFIGVGEHNNEFEEFDAPRFVSKILGFGDIEGLLEKAQEMEFTDEITNYLVKGKFTLNDLYIQIREIKKLGTLNKIVEMLPTGGIKIPKEFMEMQDEKLKIYKFIMDSMTKKEKENPEIIDSKRVARIVGGSGKKEQEVYELLKMYKVMKRYVKTMNDERKLAGFMKKLGMGKMMNM